MFRETKKIISTAFIAYYRLLNYPAVKWFCGLHRGLSIGLPAYLISFDFLIVIFHFP